MLHDIIKVICLILENKKSRYSIRDNFNGHMYSIRVDDLYVLHISEFDSKDRALVSISIQKNMGYMDDSSIMSLLRDIFQDHITNILSEPSVINYTCEPIINQILTYTPEELELYLKLL